MGSVFNVLFVSYDSMSHFCSPPKIERKTEHFGTIPTSYRSKQVSFEVSAVDFLASLLCML